MSSCIHFIIFSRFVIEFQWFVVVTNVDRIDRDPNVHVTAPPPHRMRARARERASERVGVAGAPSLATQMSEQSRDTICVGSLSAGNSLVPIDSLGLDCGRAQKTD